MNQWKATANLTVPLTHRPTPRSSTIIVGDEGGGKGPFCLPRLLSRQNTFSEPFIPKTPRLGQEFAVNFMTPTNTFQDEEKHRIII